MKMSLSWSSRIAVGVVLGAAALSGACSRGAGSPVSPSAAVPTSLDSHNGSDRFYKAGINDDSTTAGSTQSYTVRITNCDAPSCSEGEHSGAAQTIKSATVEVPSGFTNITSLSVSVSTGTNWGAPTLVGNEIQVDKGAGGQNIAPGQWVEITFTATAPCTAGDYPLDTEAYNGSDYTTAYARYGLEPQITVSGSCAEEEECPAAPAIAAHYLHDQGIHPGSSEYQNIVSQVADHMGPETDFDGYEKCDPEYAPAVEDFVQDLIDALNL